MANDRADAERLAGERYGEEYPHGYASAWRDDQGLGVSFFTATDDFDGEIVCRIVDGSLEQVS